jgi:hypothetical protein
MAQIGPKTTRKPRRIVCHAEDDYELHRVCKYYVQTGFSADFNNRAYGTGSWLLWERKNKRWSPTRGLDGDLLLYLQHSVLSIAGSNIARLRSVCSRSAKTSVTNSTSDKAWRLLHQSAPDRLSEFPAPFRIKDCIEIYFCFTGHANALEFHLR